ncbi:MAG: hypothetical protein FWB82_04325 [Treponema sp.]|nr:hypothetical protein [Treponema sp.]
MEKIQTAEAPTAETIWAILREVAASQEETAKQMKEINNRVFLGAVAGVIVKEDVREYALDKGLYLVEPSGQTFTITSPHSKPKAW